MDNTNIQFIQNLLTQIHVIQKKYDDIAEITGENFNIFKILKLEAHEVKTHSAFLAELLNPMGSHSLKDAFLKLFIEIVVSDDVESKFHLSNFDTMGIAISHVALQDTCEVYRRLEIQCYWVFSFCYVFWHTTKEWCVTKYKKLQ